MSGADLSSADLSSADLSSADLSGTNLSGSKVENITFWNNSGISDSLRRDLIDRGAIFEDSPEDCSEVLAPIKPKLYRYSSVSRFGRSYSESLSQS